MTTLVGLMKSALYSQTARQTIVEAREYIKEKYAIFSMIFVNFAKIVSV